MATDEPQPTPQLKTLTQFARSIHFTNDAAANNVQVRTAPTINVKVDVNQKTAEENRHVISLDVTVEANAGDDPVFTVEIEYAGVFEITGVPDDKLPVVLQVECPRLLFPFVRRQIADLTRDGGFMPLLLDPIDFLGLYIKRRKGEETEAAAPKSNGSA